MSTTEPATTQAASQQAVVIPAGVTVQPGRQTSQTTGQGQVVQGTLYPIILANGTTSSVFVPTSIETNVPQVQALFENKIAALAAVPVG